MSNYAIRRTFSIRSHRAFPLVFCSCKIILDLLTALQNILRLLNIAIYVSVFITHCQYYGNGVRSRTIRDSAYRPIYIDLCSAFTAIETHTFCDGQFAVFNTFGGTHDKPWRRLISLRRKDPVLSSVMNQRRRRLMLKSSRNCQMETPCSSVSLLSSAA